MTNKQIDNLYFIALIPDDKLRAEVKSLKEELETNFGASHALKSPAHITLQMPFRRPEHDEQYIIKSLEEFCKEQTSFDIYLEDYDCFEPRVIFIRVKYHQPIIDLHKSLNDVLVSKLNFNSKVLTDKLHPHMTIATRDVTEEAFEQAWPKYKSKTFNAFFRTNSLFLLKHNGKHWDIFKEISFGG